MAPARPLLLAALAFLCFGLAGNAGAHHRSGHEAGTGVAIPNLAHGQMRTIAAYRSAILELAARQASTDRDFRRLMNFARIQYAYCLWGLVPGSLADETSAFNECTHAYLAAAHALLLRMTTMPQARDDAQLLAADIDRAMFADGSALQLCRYASATFKTGAIIRPDWAQAAEAGFSMLTIPAAALLALLTFVLSRARRNR